MIVQESDPKLNTTEPGEAVTSPLKTLQPEAEPRISMQRDRLSSSMEAELTGGRE